MSRRYILITSLSGVLIAIVFWVTRLFYSVNDFRGNGDIIDLGFWAHPRFLINFSERLDRSHSTCTLQAVGLPNAQLVLQIRKPNVVRINPPLESIGFKVTKDGELVRDITYSIDKMILCSSLDGDYYWHPDFSIHADARVQYSVSVVLLASDTNINSDDEVDREDDWVIEVCLQGGGNELP